MRTAPALAGVLYGTPNRMWSVKRIGLNIVGQHRTRPAVTLNENTRGG